jgi:hypothetical protein
MDRFWRIIVFVFVANFVTLIPMMALRSTLGTEKPDAIHTVSAHVRGVGDYYFRPALGIYYKFVGPGIFLSSMGIAFLAALLTGKKE